MSNQAKNEFVRFLASAIEKCLKPQVQIAQEAGFEKANVITMIKQGKTNLPIHRIPRFADAIGVDRFLLLKLALTAYQPEVWTVIEMEIHRRVRELHLELHLT